jgi:nitrite reductase/ring-hydroxylating ferredoxin subunit
MKKYAFRNWSCSLLALGLLAVSACKKDKEDEDLIPYKPVNIQLNVTNVEYAPLRQQNGTVAIPGGVRGILVVNQGNNQYYAFERNCPFQPFDTCAVVSLDSTKLFLKDRCCGTQFDFQGNVQAGPSRRPLLRYATTYSNNLLTISN